MTLTASYDDIDGGKQAVDVMAEAIQSAPEKAVADACGVQIAQGSVTELLTVSLATSAFATSSITFKGFSAGFDFQPGREYKETDLFDVFKNVMPGDTVTDTVTFTNEATDCDFVNLYMRAEAHNEAGDPLSEKVAEKESVATMTEFLSKLSMKVWNGTELIYDASPDRLDGLKDNTLLGTFRTGDTTILKVELTVPIELDNRFANRVGEVDWIFHVEAYNESQLSVRKIWSDGNTNHDQDSITVNLLKDGEVEQAQELNAENGWAYTFDRLVEGATPGRWKRRTCPKTTRSAMTP